MKRVKKPSVRPEVARKWLKRHEEDGESVSHIAESDSYDVRTVRKYLELMRQEREVREAKQVVLRQALERHYNDICSFVERLRTDFGGDTPVRVVTPALKENPMWKALREHLPRSPLWKDIDKWEKLADSFQTSVDRINERVRKEAKSRTSLEFVSSLDRIGLYNDGLTALVVFHLKSLARGAMGFKDIAKFARTKTEHGVRVQFGAFGIGIGPEEKAREIETLCTNLLDEAEEWEEYETLSKLTQEFLRVQRSLNEELTKLALKRVVPGRCAYCPF